MQTNKTDWMKSSYSGGSGEACVVTRKALDDAAVTAVEVGDSKDLAKTPVISLSPAAWSAFVGSVSS